METCQGHNRPWLYAQYEGASFRLIFRPRCKSWHCQYCATVNRRLWVARAFNAGEVWLNNGLPLSFVTLTSHETLSARQSWYVWPRAWPKLHRKAVKQAGKGEYILIPEQCQDGRIHVHMITTWPLSKTWWKKEGRSCGLGYENDAQPARTAGGAAYYVNKYIGKQLGDFEWPKGFRRVRTSHRFPQLPPPQPCDGWTFGIVPNGIPLHDYIHELKLREQVTGLVFDTVGAWQLINSDGELSPEDLT